MKSKNIAILLLLSIYIGSCNYKLLADKRYIVQDQPGYLVFNNSQIIFFPSRDTIDTKFLADRHKKEGYKVEYDTDWLDSLSINYDTLLFIKNDVRFSIIPVEIKYYLGSTWQLISDKSTVDYRFNDNTHTLSYEIVDYRQILGISLVRDSDRKRLKDMPVDTTKFVPPHWHPVE
jgi:hypothetical protein